jgi:hypothetical protein
LANVLSIGSFLHCWRSQREIIDSEEKNSKILTWFNSAAVAAGTKAAVEEDEEEAEEAGVACMQIARAHEERIAACSVS